MIEPLRLIHRDEVADHYDDLDAFYREVWGEHVHHGLWTTGRESSEEAVRQLVGHLAARLQIPVGARIVDVGSGYGATARQLAEDLQAEVHAITLSAAQHAFAMDRAAASSAAYYHLGDWLTNEFPAESFDFAIAIESTEHMQDKLGAIRQMRRVLAPGGKVGIYAWIAADSPRKWMVGHLLEPICREGRLPGMGTEGDYRELLRSAGLELQAVEDLSDRVSPTWRLTVTRVARRVGVDGRYRRYLFNQMSRNRDFAISLLRILAAYRVGAMRYLLFVARRPTDE